MKIRIFAFLAAAFILLPYPSFTEEPAGSQDTQAAGAGTVYKLDEKGGSSLRVSQAKGGGEKEMLVDLELKDADIKDIARAFSRVSGKNIIVSEEVSSKATLRVKDMGWREVLSMILETNGLTMLEKDNYIVVTTPEKRKSGEESGELQTKIITLNFVEVANIQKTLSSMLTQRGKMEIDVRTNSLVITDIPDIIRNIEKVAIGLDTKTPQVLIEAMMLTVKLNDESDLGVEWTLTHKTRDERELTQSLGLGTGAGTDYLWQLNYGKTLFTKANLDLTVQALIEQQRADILANPRVLTLDNLAATIDLTEQVAYTQQSTSTESSSSVSSVQYMDVPVKLVVKPHVTKDNHIIMNIQTEQSFVSGYVTGQPQIDSRKAETNVMVRDGETVVIGGLRKKEYTTTVNKVPILGDIPLVGAMFRRDVKTKVDSELIIFVTPYIANDLKFANSEQKHFDHVEALLGRNKPLSLKRPRTFSLRPPGN